LEAKTAQLRFARVSIAHRRFKRLEQQSICLGTSDEWIATSVRTSGREILHLPANARTALSGFWSAHQLLQAGSSHLQATEWGVG